MTPTDRLEAAIDEVQLALASLLAARQATTLFATRVALAAFDSHLQDAQQLVQALMKDLAPDSPHNQQKTPL